MGRALWTLVVLLAPALATAAGPRIEVRLPAGDGPSLGGRLVVALAPGGREPVFTEADAPGLVVVGVDATLAPGRSAVLGADVLAFPSQAAWADLPAGTYTVRAVFATNRDVSTLTAAGNRYCAPARVALKPDAVTVLTLDRVHADASPADSATHQYLTLPSRKLSAFHGRPMACRVGVVLPKDFAADTTKRYPLAVHVGGFGQRYTSARRTPPDARFVQLHLDGAGPFGDPYQVNSAVNGPYGDALVEEIIPEVERRFRCIGTGKTRFVEGGSTGGWVSLALQLFYPDTFNGCWAQCPDGVDFRAFQLADLSRDANMYVNQHGFDRPARRTVDGDTVYTVRHECRLEQVLGRGGQWTLGGQQWASWNAVYGPRAADGSPVPLWDGTTGVFDRNVVKQWGKYDLRKHLEREWPTLGPKLAGKVHIWVGDADDYFLNNAVHRFQAAAKQLANPAFDGVIEIVPRMGHTSGWGRAKVLDAMAARAGK